MKTPNKANLKRKLTEVIPFNIMEKYKSYFSFKNAYYPSLSNLQDLKSFISEKLDNCEKKEEKIKINEDKEKIEKLIENYEDKKASSDCSITIYDGDKKGKQIKMVLKFLRFCKKFYNPIVHASRKDLNYYLLPSCVFSSNLKYADYVFSLTDIIQDKKDYKDKSDNKNNDDYKKKDKNDDLDKNDNKYKNEGNEKDKNNEKDEIDDDKDKNDEKDEIDDDKDKNNEKDEIDDDKDEYDDEEDKENNDKDESDDEGDVGVVDNNKINADEKDEPDDKDKNNNKDLRINNEKDKNNNYNDIIYDKEKNGNKTTFIKINDDYYLYKEEKIINIKEALQILFFNQRNNLNEINTDKLMESKKEYQMKLRLFNKNIGSLLELLQFQKDENFELNDDIKNKENDLFNKLNALDISISDIINDNLKREEAENIIKLIGELIDTETKELKMPYSKFRKLNIDIDSKTNRIYLIINFLQNQKEKIDNARKSIYREYENYLNILIRQTNEYKDYLRDFTSNDVNLFEKWAEVVSKKYKGKKKKFLQLDVLMNNFYDLLTSVKIDFDYSYDEKFYLWTIKNNFSDYLK